MSTESNNDLTDENIFLAPDHEPTVEPVAAAVQYRTNSKRLPSPAGQAVSGLPVDDVLLSSCVFKNPAAKKSLSVHHLQRRLAELGYPDAYTDKDGWYGDLTKLAVAAYQEDNGLSGDGLVDGDTLESIFVDDQNVRVVLS